MSDPGGTDPEETATGGYATALEEAIGLRRLADSGDAAELRFDPTPITRGNDEEPVWLHGGALAVCVESASWEAIVRLAAGEWVAVDLRVDFLRPAREAPHRVRATARRIGRRLAVADVEITPWDEPDRPVALGRAVYART
jgi:uncharacterized protein (TIGR00369 family)